MKKVIAHLKSIGAYSQSRVVTETKQSKESHEEFEARIWPKKAHSTPDGFVCIPPTAFKNCLAEAAKFLSLQIPGKGKATFTKHFESGVLCVDPMILDIKVADLQSERLFLPASGKRGDGRRVWRTFPLIPSWSGDVVFHVLDETVLQSMPDDDMTVFEHVLNSAGQLIGIGRFRPRNNGYYGRFVVDNLKIEDA